MAGMGAMDLLGPSEGPRTYVGRKDRCDHSGGKPWLLDLDIETRTSW
jgi:hypothetical protein